MNRYLEIIELRTSGQNREKLENVFEKLLAGLYSDIERGQIQVYHSRMIEGDFCILLHMQAENSNREGSPLGLHMVSALREYGLVHHNMWCEMHFPTLKDNKDENNILWL